MAPKSEEIREEMAETRARIDQDIDALQDKFRRSTEPLEIVRDNPLPVLAAAAGLGLLLAAIFVRRRDEGPPMPPGKSRRRRVARVIETAEDEGLLNEDARRVLISLLTAQGLKWLQNYIEEEGRKATAGARQSAAATVESLGEATTRARERTEARAHDLKQSADASLDDLSSSVASTMESAREQVGERAHEVEAKLGEAKERASEALHEGADRARATLDSTREKGEARLAALAERGTHAGSEAENKVKERGKVAHSLAEEATESAESRGSSFINRMLGRQ